MLIQHAGSGRQPTVVDFVDRIIIIGGKINVTHSDGNVITEKTVGDGCVLMIRPDDDMFISAKVAEKDGRIRTIDRKDSVRINIHGDNVSINCVNFYGPFSVFVEELPA